MDKCPVDTCLVIFFMGLLPTAATLIQQQISFITPTSFAVDVLHAGDRSTGGGSWTVVVAEAIRDGVNLGKTLLDVAKWPLDQATSLLTSLLMVTSSLIALFNLAVDLLVRPGGSGAILLSWLRANSTQGSRQLISASASTGASLASDLLTAARWPLDVGLNLLGASLMVHSTLMTLFNMAVDLFRPTGAGPLLLSWLRGAPGRDATAT